jgi:integrase
MWAGQFQCEPPPLRCPQFLAIVSSAPFEQWMRAKPLGITLDHIRRTRKKIELAVRGGGWLRLADITEDSFLDHLATLDVRDKTKNRHRAAVVSFVKWCFRTKRLIENPLAGVARFRELNEPAFKRRPLTPAEVAKLLEATKRGKVQADMSDYFNPQ